MMLKRVHCGLKTLETHKYILCDLNNFCILFFQSKSLEQDMILWNEDDQSILYTCMKCHNEIHYYVQLVNANKRIPNKTSNTI